MLLAEFIWAPDPVAFELGPLTIRWYGLIFAATILTAFFAWKWQVKRGGYSNNLADGFVLWGVIATIVGARLGHCFFYEAERYLANPLEIFEVWNAGLASHGATIGLVIAVILYALRHKMRIIEAMDRFAFAAAVGSAGVRLGNFMNSEIVGRATDLPWAVKLPRHDFANHFQEYTYAAPELKAAMLDAIPARHPSQLYEFLMGMGVLLILLLADRLAGREKRPLGLMAGLFLVCYFTGRFCVEFVKEYQALQDSFLTMGQYLSVIPVLFGLGVLAWCLIRRKPTHPTLAELREES